MAGMEGGMGFCEASGFRFWAGRFLKLVPCIATLPRLSTAPEQDRFDGSHCSVSRLDGQDRVARGLLALRFVIPLHLSLEGFDCLEVDFLRLKCLGGG